MASRVLPLLLLLLLLLPPTTPNPCGPGACRWWSGTSNAGEQECGRTSDPNSPHIYDINGYSTTCYRCLAGRYQPSSAWETGGCIACGAGRYSSSTGASSCIDCGVVQTSDPGAYECHTITWQVLVLVIVVCASVCGFLLLFRVLRSSAGTLVLPASAENTQEQNTKVAKLAAILQLDEASARSELVHANWDLQVATDTALAMQGAARVAVEEEAARQPAEDVHLQREANQAKLVTDFMRERFADEATARRFLAQTNWNLEQAMPLYMPPAPHSPMLGRSLNGSSFKGGYEKATVPKGQLQLGAVLVTMIQAYCAKNGIPYEEDEGERYFEQLQAEALTSSGDPIDVMAQRMWTSALQLRGKEFCFMLNDAVRDDTPALAGTLGKIARAINQLCVTADRETAAVHPPNFVCYRGAGFDEAYRSFFVAGRRFRQPAYLATSFSREVALRFLRRSTMAAKVLWLIRIDPQRKCAHVNLVQESNVPGEEEYLFAPYSAFTLITSKWGSGTDEDPHVIELAAAPDNKAEPEDLPLAPWA